MTGIDLMYGQDSDGNIRAFPLAEADGQTVIPVKVAGAADSNVTVVGEKFTAVVDGVVSSDTFYNVVFFPLTGLVSNMTPVYFLQPIKGITVGIINATPSAGANIRLKIGYLADAFGTRVPVFEKDIDTMTLPAVVAVGDAVAASGANFEVVNLPMGAFMYVAVEEISGDGTSTATISVIATAT